MLVSLSKFLYTTAFSIRAQVWNSDLLSDEEDEDSSDDGHEVADMADASDDDRTVQNQAAMDTLVPGIEPSEYGKMPPSFHRHSQRVARDPDAEARSPMSSISDSMLPSRPPLLARDKYEGVDSDDETDESDSEEGGSDDERPQLVGDVEIDMGEEQDEFLEFARHALGVTDEQWEEILNERIRRGGMRLTLPLVFRLLMLLRTAFVPEIPSDGSKSQNKEFSAFTATSPPVRPPRAQSDAGPNLDSFEAVMRAMDAELARKRPAQTASRATGHDHENKGKGKERASTVADTADIEAAMDADLEESIQRGADDDDGPGDVGEDVDVDYNLIKNFLESFRSQAGLSGPVSNLAGRLQSGWSLPRDTS